MIAATTPVLMILEIVLILFHSRRIGRNAEVSREIWSHRKATNVSDEEFVRRPKMQNHLRLDVVAGIKCDYLLPECLFFTQFACLVTSVWVRITPLFSLAMWYQCLRLNYSSAFHKKLLCLTSSQTCPLFLESSMFHINCSVRGLSYSSENPHNSMSHMLSPDA